LYENPKIVRFFEYPAPGKDGNLMEFVNTGKLREIEIYSGNFCISEAVILMKQSEAHNKQTETAASSGLLESTER